jgi:hypothetical protein
VRAGAEPDRFVESRLALSGDLDAIPTISWTT